MGQRRGIGIPSNTDNEFYVVTGFDLENNRLRVAFESPRATGLYTSEVDLHSISALNKPLDRGRRILAKPRYRDPSQAIEFAPTGDGCAHVVFDTPQRALASGQILALYDGETLLGGGYYA